MRNSFLDNLLAFGQSLRAAGLDVHIGRMLDAIEAIQHVDLASRDEVYHTLRTLLIHRHQDFATFDRVFAEFWRGATGSERQDDAPAAAADVVAVPATIVIKTWSDAETISEKDFAALTAGELALARAVIEKLPWTP